MPALCQCKSLDTELIILPDLHLSEIFLSAGRLSRCCLCSVATGNQKQRQGREHKKKNTFFLNTQILFSGFIFYFDLRGTIYGAASSYRKSPSAGSVLTQRHMLAVTSNMRSLKDTEVIFSVGGNVWVWIRWIVYTWKCRDSSISLKE